MGNSPLVSVCVTAYNYARFLPDCIESVIAQTISDWELIICDDNSADSTEELCRRYAAKDSRIRYYRNNPGLGMNPNLKRVAELGQGRYLKVLCADDWLAPNCLERLMRIMEAHPNVVLATSAEINCNVEGIPQKVQFLFGKTISILRGEAMLDRAAMGHGLGGNSSFMIRASAYRQIGGYDADCVYAGDFDLAVRLCRVGDYLHTDEPLFYSREHLQRTAHIYPQKLVDVQFWLQIAGKIFSPRRIGNREWYRYQMMTAYQTARYLLKIALEHLRGHHEHALKLRRLVFSHGNLWLGALYLPIHFLARVYRRLTGKNKPFSISPQPGMGVPSAWPDQTSSKQETV